MMKYLKFILLKILISFLFVSASKAQSNESLFNSANQAYQSGNFAAAAEQYEKILQSGSFSKETYFNLGNCYYRLGSNARAVLNYERALRLTPSDAEIWHNLSLTRARLSDDIEAVDNTFIVKWFRQLRGWLSPDGWAAFGLLFFWFGIGASIIWLLGQQRMWKKRGFIAASILIPLSLLPFLMGKSAAYSIDNTQSAVVMVRETPVKDAPVKEANSSLMIHEGLKVDIQESLGQFFKVKLPNGEIGWIEQNAVERI